MSEGELLHEDVCSVLVKDGEREAVVRVCEYEGGESGRVDSLARNGCVEMEVEGSGLEKR